MRSPVSIVIVGMGGYGNVYLTSLLEEPEDAAFRIVGAVDPEPERCAFQGKLKALKVPVYSCLEEFYMDQKADLAVLSSPIHLHCPQTLTALSHGSNVLCEKPAAARVEEVDRMIEAREKAQKKVAIGYQWSFSESILELKRDIMKGRYGAPVRLKALCLWPRDASYYHRNSWAGRKRTDGNEWVMDSPVNNAMAHFLHNMLFLAGKGLERSAEPKEVEAELYRANEIENYDTAALRVRTTEWAEILLFVSHAIPEDVGPRFHMTFKKGEVIYHGGATPMEGRSEDGTLKTYPHPDSESQTRKLWTMIRAVRGEEEIPCGLEAAKAQTVCMNAAQDSMPDIIDFPEEVRRSSGEGETKLNWIEGLQELFQQCYEKDALPSELGAQWAKPGRKVECES